MFKRIAVHLEQDSNCARRLRTAVALAAEHNAELVGIYVGYLQPQYVFDDTIVPDEIYAALQRRQRDEKKAIEDLFFRESKAGGVTGLWKEPEGSPERILALHARHCDLLVIGQVDPSGSDSVIVPHLTASIIMSAGRPVLMIPCIGDFPRVGRRVLFCWDRGREAARALADASPILQQAAGWAVLTIDPQSETIRSRDIDRRDFLAYCASHGFPVPREIKRESTPVGIGNTIIDAAANEGFDLIVMGAYGHSRLREWAMGGATHALLQSMKVPTLFSH